MGRRGNRSRVAIALALVVGFLATVSFSSALSATGRAGPAHPSAGSSAIVVTVGNLFTFSLSTNEVQPNDTVQVTVHQTGSLTHTFTLGSVAGYRFAASSTTDDLNRYFASHSPLVNISVPDVPGDYSKSFVAPAKIGTYEFVCLQAGHFGAGMYGVLGVGVAPETIAPPNTGPGAAVFIIGGVIAILVVATLVVAFVVGRRHGARHEMPPERLGYSETPGNPPPPKH